MKNIVTIIAFILLAFQLKAQLHINDSDSMRYSYVLTWKSFNPSTTDYISKRRGFCHRDSAFKYYNILTQADIMFLDKSKNTYKTEIDRYAEFIKIDSELISKSRNKK